MRGMPCLLFFLIYLKTLTFEVCYSSYIRHILEYANILYDNCTVENCQKMESVQITAARPATGVKKHTSHQSLYRELGWVTLETRRKIHRLSKMFSIINKYSPMYLQNIIAHLIPDHRHNTRLQTQNNLTVWKCNLSIYQKSFINCTVLDWNSLTNDVKKSPSLLTFKIRLMRLFNCKALLFNHDNDRNTQVAFMQIRMGFSNYNFDLYFKACINDPTYSCGFGNEDASHYFLRCPNYGIRQTLVTNFSSQLNLVATLPSILFGGKTLTETDNMKLFKFVYKFIQELCSFNVK